MTVSGLTNGVSYVCYVSATDDAGNSQASEASSVTPAGDADGDGVNDLFDNCVSVSNPGQESSAILCPVRLRAILRLRQALCTS